MTHAAVQAAVDIDASWMRRALELAESAASAWNEVPVGAVLVDAQGHCLAEGQNGMIAQNDPTAHAEIMVLRAAGQRVQNYRLPAGCCLYVTLEPCAMCAMAMVHARLARVVFAASDPKTGACGSVFSLLSDPRHNHQVAVSGGLFAEQAGLLLRNFFRAKRGKSV